MIERKFNFFLVGICIIGFCIRVFYGIYIGDSLVFPDEERFWGEVNSLLDSGEFYWNGEHAHDMPLTALVIAGFVKITGAGIAGTRIFLALLSSTTIYMITILTRLYSTDKLAQLLAATIASLYPFFIYYSPLILSETVFLLVLTTYFYFLLRSHPTDYISAGVFGGLVHLVRPSLYYFYPIIVVMQRCLLNYSWRKSVLTIVLTIIVVSPWIFRNQQVFGEYIPSTVGIGQVLWEGNNPYNVTGGTAGDFRGTADYLAEMPRGLSELERDKWKMNMATSYIANNPNSFIENGFRKLLRFWNLWPNHPAFNNSIYKYISLFSFGPVLAGFIVGIWLLRDQWKKMLPLVIFFGYYSAIHMVTIGSIRYRLPLEPFMISIAAITYSKLFNSWRSRVR